MTKVVVAGGGIAGLALAAGLRRAGVETVVLEAGPTLEHEGAGISLWPNALAALDAVGAGDAVRSIGTTAEATELRRPDGRVLSRVARALAEAVLGGPPVCVHRGELLDALDGAAGRCTRYGAVVAAVRQHEGGVVVTLRSGDELEADALIGADGVRSAVAAHLQPGLAPHYAGWTAWRGVADLPEGVELTAASETWGRGERFGLVPLGGGRVYWFATANRPEGERAEAGEWLEVVERFTTWHDPIPSVLKVTDPDAVLRHDIYDRDRLRHWVKGRVAVIGDAAHPMQPNLGQGACQALEDAAVLARALTAPDVDVPDALAAYEHQRRRTAERVVRRSRRLGRVAQHAGRLGCAVRDAALRVTPASATVRSLRSFAAYR